MTRTGRKQTQDGEGSAGAFLPRSHEVHHSHFHDGNPTEQRGQARQSRVSAATSEGENTWLHAQIDSYFRHRDARTQSAWKPPGTRSAPKSLPPPMLPGVEGGEAGGRARISCRRHWILWLVDPITLLGYIVTLQLVPVKYYIP